MPNQRTSVSWERKWALKPDIVLEGGNWAALGDQMDCPDDLGLLTTYRNPTTQPFDIFRDTSAATALGANLGPIGTTADFPEITADRRADRFQRPLRWTRRFLWSTLDFFIGSSVSIRRRRPHFQLRCRG